MLVLLIIMMLVAPMLQKGVDVRLPQRREYRGQARNAGADRRRHPGQQADLSELGACSARAISASRVADLVEKQTEKVVLIKADQDVDYGTVMETMDNLRAAGIEDMGLITDPKVRAGGN